MSAPAIHIGPEPLDHLVRAVEDGGGRVVGLDEAEAIVWAGPETDFPDELPATVRWVRGTATRTRCSKAPPSRSSARAASAVS
jgi:hypothetical protein